MSGINVFAVLLVLSASFAAHSGELILTSIREAAVYDFVFDFLWKEYGGWFDRERYLLDMNQSSMSYGEQEISVEYDDYIVASDFQIQRIDCESNCQHGSVYVLVKKVGVAQGGFISMSRGSDIIKYEFSKKKKGGYGLLSIGMPIISVDFCKRYFSNLSVKTSYLSKGDASSALIDARKKWSENLKVCSL